MNKPLAVERTGTFYFERFALRPRPGAGTLRSLCTMDYIVNYTIWRKYSTSIDTTGVNYQHMQDAFYLTWRYP
jgi:hypothetical protein